MRGGFVRWNGRAALLRLSPRRFMMTFLNKQSQFGLCFLHLLKRESQIRATARDSGIDSGKQVGSSN
jgi:hypothetical protein